MLEAELVDSLIKVLIDILVLLHVCLTILATAHAGFFIIDYVLGAHRDISISAILPIFDLTQPAIDLLLICSHQHHGVLL